MCTFEELKRAATTFIRNSYKCKAEVDIAEVISYLREYIDDAASYTSDEDWMDNNEEGGYNPYDYDYDYLREVVNSVLDKEDLFN